MLIRVKDCLLDPEQISGVVCLNEDVAAPEQVCTVLLRTGKGVNVRATMRELYVILQPLIKALPTKRVIHKSGS